MNTKEESFEELENCKTGDTCVESGRYFCKDHPYIEITISEDEYFPKCDQKNIPHRTIWFKLTK